MDEFGNANSALVKLLQKRKHEHETDLPRREKSHIAIVTMRIDIRPINSDNTFDNYKLANKDLEKYNMATKAQFIIKGPSEAECVNKLKRLLEKINDQ